MISESDKRYLLSIKPEDIDFNLLVNLFGDRSNIKDGKFKNNASRFNPTDEFILNANEYFNTEKITTTVGLFIYNKFIVEERFKGVLGYINTTVSKGGIKVIEAKLAKALLNDVIQQADFVYYLNRVQWLAMKFHIVISCSITPGTIKPNPTVIAERNKLFKENKEKLDNNDINTAAEIETKLLSTAQNVLKNDVGMDLYNSGARGSFNNNYKNICIMRGPVFDPVRNQYDIIQSNFMEGIKKDEIPTYGNLVVTGAYPKAVGTQISGYLSKQITAAMQSVVLDVKDSDCGSKNYLEVTLAPELKNDFVYRYIIEGSKLVLIDDSNIDKYIGKKIKLRSPMYCISDKVCNKCAGDIYYKLGLVNLGLTATRVSSTLLNLNMKKFHDSSINMSKVDINNLVI
jgi:hypothetical protein